MSNYEQLHRQCRTLENLFDTKLTSYSQLASSISRHNHDIEATGSAERWRDLEAELDDLLEKACVERKFADTMPGINNILGMIRSRRRRDSIILGTVIGVCIILILTYMWS
ncbi:hypothetical protein DXG03_008423 [Asterophora parasitica]|uniref:Golgi SNAP receptor complex member 1 n=1 Tax=Asterophora parasitica TaxID=117018 RepID=A0A9P7KGC8_9AGAR|nr:hypothetical protein DXG03_008423 [Asterophora parasitica]